MSKLGSKHMKEAIQRHEDQVAGRERDMFITIGMYMAEVVLANEFGWGKKRLSRLERGVHALCKNEIKQGAKPYTDQYAHNVEHGFVTIAKRLEQIHGEGHCEWLKNAKWG